MAQEIKQKDWEAEDLIRMQEAVAEIRKSANLRFFMRSLLGGLGVTETPEGANALLTARACGRHSVGMDLIATLQQHDQELYPALLIEESREQQERGNTNGY